MAAPNSPPDLATPMRLGPHMVPGLWRYLLPPSLTALTIPDERRSTCGSCPRVRTDGYRPDYKCCTYWPRIANFLLGLSLDEPGGRAKLEAVRPYLVPEGFLPSPRGWADFLEDVGEDRFGKSTSVLCPFLQRESGLCGIYQFRNGVCSTYFCHYDHGKRGEGFWESLQTTVTQTEMALGQWALTQVGFDVAAYIGRLNDLAADMRTASRRQGGWSDAARRHVWGEAYGSELDVFAACAAAVRTELDDLWKHANSTNILEADRFETACQKLVSPKHQDQIEDDFSDPDRETIKPRELWKDVMRRHRRLWQLPDGKLRLADTAEVVLNPEDDADARHNAAKPFMLTFRGQRLFLTVKEAEALGQFVRPVRVSPPLLARVAHILTDNAERFVSEWIGKQVLVNS